MDRAMKGVVTVILGVLLVLVALPGTPRLGASPYGQPFELIAYGRWDDELRLESSAAPEMLYRVPLGQTLWLTDLDAATTGLVLLRRRGQTVEQVALAQTARSFTTGILFDAGDELLVQAAGTHVEWLALRGELRAEVTTN